MIHRGKPYVPQECPNGQNGDIANIAAVKLRLLVARTVLYGRPATEVYGVFGDFDDIDPVPNIVTTDSLLVPEESPLAKKVLAIVKDDAGYYDEMAGVADNRANMGVEQARTIFCGRIANCQGVVRGGCWALRESAVREVMETID